MIVMRRFRKRFKRPKSPFDTEQINEGKEIKKKFGLRRKKEMWIAQEVLRQYRQRARNLIAVSDPEGEKVLLDKLVKIGLLAKGSNQLDDVLGLTLENLLERRLQTVLFRKELTKTVSQARQAIVHGHVTLDGKRMVFPSYTVKSEEESKLQCSFKPPEPQAKHKGVVKKPPEAAAEETAKEEKETPGKETAGEPGKEKA